MLLDRENGPESGQGERKWKGLQAEHTCRKHGTDRDQWRHRAGDWRLRGGPNRRAKVVGEDLDWKWSCSQKAESLRRQASGFSLISLFV